MAGIDAHLLDRLSHAAIERVTFYKIDEVTTDLICCDVEANGEVRTFHEELAGWDLLLTHLAQLPNFRSDWFGAVMQPPFERSETVAFIR